MNAMELSRLSLSRHYRGHDVLVATPQTRLASHCI